MSFVSELMNIAVADTDVLRSLDEQGDVFSVARDVNIFLRAPDRDKAELVCSYVNDYSYGVAEVQESDGAVSVAIVIHMPVTQPVLLSVSGFIATICQLYGLEYDGWGCLAQSP